MLKLSTTKLCLNKNLVIIKIKTMNRFVLIIVILLYGLSAKSQQDAMFTHYAFNTLAINPAYAGSRDALTVTALHRSQWVSFPGAPMTQTLTMHTPFISKNVGLGLSVLNDRLGPTNTTSLYADFSYRIKVNKKSWLAFGLKGGLNIRKADLVETIEANDPVFVNEEKSDYLPNFGFGLYYYTHRYYVGVSIPKLLENDFKSNDVQGSTNLGSEKKHYFLIAGAVFNLSKNIMLKPTGFLKVTNGAPLEGDLTASFIFNNRFWVGGMYRSNDALGLLAGINITKQFSVGYSYDWSYTNTTFRYNGGSHEIMLRYDFIFSDNIKVRSPRYF